MPKFVLLLVLPCIALLAAGLAGTYSGTWSGSSGASGDFHISLTPGENGAWKSDVTFTFGGADVNTKVTSVKVDGTKVIIVYQFDLQETRLESTATGQLNGNQLDGTYSTKVVADGSAVDEGTWKTTVAQ